MNKGKKLSVKEKGFAEDYVNENGNGTQAALNNYNVKDRKMASVIGTNNLRKEKVRREIDRIMEERGLTDNYLVTKINDGLNANVVTDYKGEVTKTEVADLNTRHKYLNTALELVNAYPAKQIESRSVNIDLQLEQMPKEEILKLLQSELQEIKQEINQNKASPQKV